MGPAFLLEVERQRTVGVSTVSGSNLRPLFEFELLARIPNMLPDAVSLDVKDSSNELRKYICVIGLI
jgi:hypothetical protein